MGEAPMLPAGLCSPVGTIAPVSYSGAPIPQIGRFSQE